MRAWLLAAVAVTFCLCGCVKPPVVVASEDLGLVRMEHNGVPGWWAPQATMAELMQARQEGERVR